VVDVVAEGVIDDADRSPADVHARALRAVRIGGRGTFAGAEGQLSFEAFAASFDCAQGRL